MEELQSSLDAYEAQLSQVQQALQADPSNADLVQLKTDLDQIILLTSQSLLEEKKKQLLDHLDQTEVVQKKPEIVGRSRDDEDVHAELEKLVGMKCRAPHRSKGSGTVSLSNAVIYDVEKDGTETPESVMVRVVFSHPLSADMVACPFFMDGKCRFGEDECRYSHGEAIRLVDLREFVEPDFSTLVKGSSVLAKRTGPGGGGDKEKEVWSHATVLEVGDGGESVRVQFRQNHREVSRLELDSIFPLSSESVSNSSDEDSEGEAAGPSSRDETCVDPTAENEIFVPVDIIGDLSSSSLGEWERHTRGVGSRLMAKMGYVTGAGLGRSSEGRVLPVPARVYPQGRSLDWCMEAREKAGAGGDVITVEKRLRREKEREERRSRKKAEAAEERERRENSLFAFINRSIFAGVGKHSVELAKNTTNRSSTSKVTTGDGKKKKSCLNMKTFQVGEDIRRAEREAARLSAAHARHRDHDPAAAAAIAGKLADLRKRLRELREKEGTIDSARSLAEGNKKLSIF